MVEHVGWVPGPPGWGRLDLLTACLQLEKCWCMFLGVPRGLCHHYIEEDGNQTVAQGVFGALGWITSPALTQCSGESCFPSPRLTDPCSVPGKPSKGSAIQLPGKVFTHFQDWSTDLYGGDRQQRSLSAYYCHSFFDAITTGGCLLVQPSPKTCTPQLAAVLQQPGSALISSSGGKGGLGWSTAPYVLLGLVALLMHVAVAEWSIMRTQ